MGSIAACGTASGNTVVPQAETSETEPAQEVISVNGDCQTYELTPGLASYTSDPEYRLVRMTLSPAGVPVASMTAAGDPTVYTPYTATGSIVQIGGNSTVSASTVWAEGGEAGGLLVYGPVPDGFAPGADLVLVLRGGQHIGTEVADAFPVTSDEVYLPSGCWVADGSSAPPADEPLVVPIDEFIEIAKQGE